jgi:hypothetical protein
MLSSILNVKATVSGNGYIAPQKKSVDASSIIFVKMESPKLPKMIFRRSDLRFPKTSHPTDTVRLIRTYRAMFTLPAQTEQSRKIVLSVFKTEVQDMASAFKAANGVQAPTTPHFETSEEAEDERKWEAIVSTFSPNDFALLDDWANELIQESGTEPLDFTGR